MIAAITAYYDGLNYKYYKKIANVVINRNEKKNEGKEKKK